MRKFEKRFNSLVIGSVFPLSFGLLSVMIWMLLDKSESRPLLYLTVGLLLGLLIDFKYLKKWIQRRYDMPIGIVISILLVYHIFVYGFFMGLPVFNVFLGLLAGYYSGKRICFNKIEPNKHTKLINQASLISGLIMTLICISSGFLALKDYGAAGMIENVLGLDFKITNSMMWGLVLIGGLILIMSNIFMTRYTMIKTIKSTPANTQYT